MNEPGTANARAAKRAEIRQHWLADAERKASQSMRSLKCGGYTGTTEPRHAGVQGGCANDGSTCLCECHDPKDGAS